MTVLINVKSSTNSPTIEVINAIICNLEIEVILAENILYLVILCSEINIDMIVYTPLNLPKIEPDNWDVFWNMWNNHSDIAVKRSMNFNGSRSKIGDSNIWRGLDIFKVGNIPTSWECPYFDIRNTLPLLYEAIRNLKIRSLYRVRLLQSISDIGSHSDDNNDTWKVRAFLYYPSTVPQWYFTKPNDTERVYIDLPESTNWFAYNDKHAWHGTDYDPENKKILLQLYFLEPIDDLIKSSIEIYKPYTISF